MAVDLIPLRSGRAALPEPAADRLVRRLPLRLGKKGLIKVGYACNNHCTFCHTLDLRDLDGTGPLVMRKIDRARELGYAMVVLSGGEVTMRKELLAWAARTAALGLDFGLVTNARMLAYPDLVDQLMRLRLGYVYLSLHGPPRIHNAMVRADAFDETFAAIRQLSGRNLDLTVNTVVTNTNLGHLRETVDLLLPFPDLTLKFSMTQPKGGASVDHAFRALIPDIAACGARVSEAIAHGRAQVAARGGIGPRFAHDGIPFCLLDGHEELYDDLRTHGFAAMTEAFEPDFFPVDNGATVQPDAICGPCALRGPCPGLFTAYDEAHGRGALRTVTRGARSNSLTYATERALPLLPGGGCPVHASPLPYDLGRTLFLEDGERLIQHRTESRDFHDRETRRFKNELGQLYLDVSDKPAPDDFARDLRKLVPADRCLPCDRRGECAGAYRVVEEDVFTPADAAVRAAIAAAIAVLPPGGLCVDIGCGDDGRYADLWQGAVTAGRARYLGVEPDEGRAEAMRRRFAWAEVQSCPVEAVEVGGAPIDALLVLRSWNHLVDPAAALAPLVARMRPGAMLLVVDNVAFGLVRSAAQRQRCERSSAAWEHHRNDESGEARAALAALPLEFVREAPITAEGSNQWVLELRRSG